MAIVDIDPDGDVIIKIGDDDLRVSSQVLCLASPVFKAVLRSGFKEGLTAETSAQNPKHIALPDEGSTAFNLVCKVIHFQLDTLPRSLSVDALEQLSVICDKYQVIVPMLSLGTSWVLNKVPDSCVDELCRLLTVASLLDLPEAFYEVSRMILHLSCGELASLERDLNARGLEQYNLLSVFEYVNKRYLSAVRDVFFDQVMNLARNPCKRCQKTTFVFLGYMENENLVPQTDESFWDYQLVVEDLGAFEAINGCYKSTCGSAANKGTTDLVAGLIQRLNTTLAMHGLCLDCLKRSKHDRTVDSQHTCRVQYCTRSTAEAGLIYGASGSNRSCVEGQ